MGKVLIFIFCLIIGWLYLFEGLIILDRSPKQGSLEAIFGLVSIAIAISVLFGKKITKYLIIGFLLNFISGLGFLYINNSRLLKSIVVIIVFSIIGYVIYRVIKYIILRIQIYRSYRKVKKLINNS